MKKNGDKYIQTTVSAKLKEHFESHSRRTHNNNNRQLLRDLVYHHEKLDILEATEEQKRTSEVREFLGLSANDDGDGGNDGIVLPSTKDDGTMHVHQTQQLEELDWGHDLAIPVESVRDHTITESWQAQGPICEGIINNLNVPTIPESVLVEKLSQALELPEGYIRRKRVPRLVKRGLLKRHPLMTLDARQIRIKLSQYSRSDNVTVDDPRQMTDSERTRFEEDIEALLGWTQLWQEHAENTLYCNDEWYYEVLSDVIIEAALQFMNTDVGDKVHKSDIPAKCWTGDLGRQCLFLVVNQLGDLLPEGNQIDDILGILSEFRSEVDEYKNNREKYEMCVKNLTEEVNSFKYMSGVDGLQDALEALKLDCVPDTENDLEDQFRELTVSEHPDQGGDSKQYSRIVDARQTVRKAIESEVTRKYRLNTDAVESTNELNDDEYEMIPPVPRDEDDEDEDEDKIIQNPRKRGEDIDDNDFILDSDYE